MATPTTLAEALVILNETNVRLGMSISETEITAENLGTIGTLRPDLVDSILGIMNIVLTQRFYRPMFDATKNKFRAFLRDLQENGWGALEVFQQFIAGRVPMWSSTYTDAQRADDLSSYEPDSIVKQYHTKPIERQFKTTTDRKDYKKVFTAAGLPQYIDNKIANMSASAEYWLLQQIIATIKSMVDANDCVYNVGHTINNEKGCKTVLEAIRSTAEGMVLPSDDYNKLGVVNLADSKKDVFLITTPDKMERIRTRIFTNAFNMSETDLPFTTLYAPNGTDLGTDPVTSDEVLFILIDRKALFIGLDLYEATSKLAENTLWIQHFLSIRGIASYNRFFSCVAFTGTFGEWEGASILLNENVKDNFTMTINTVAKDANTKYPIVEGDTIGLSWEITGASGNITVVVTYLSGDISIINYDYDTVSPISYVVPSKVASIGISANIVAGT